MTGKRRKGNEPSPEQPNRPDPNPTPAAPPASSPAQPLEASLPPVEQPPAFVAPVVPDVISPMPTRREERQRRRKEQRRKVGLAGGLAIALVTIVVIGAVAFGVHKVTESHGSTPRTQGTVLFQLQGANHTATASALLAHDPATHQGVQVLIPARVITNVCGFGSQNFGDVLDLPNGSSASRVSLSSMLGDVTVDGSWVLNESQFVKLIDALGGHITVDSVDVNVVRPQAGGGSVILVPQGANVKLTGTQAFEYATYVAHADEPAAAELARLQQVLDGVLSALPKSPAGIAAVLRQSGVTSSSTVDPTKLSTLLAGLAGDNNRTGDLYATDLPTATIDAGGSPSYRIDGQSAALKNLVSLHLANSLPPGAGTPKPTVLLLNGLGSVGLVDTACPRLAAHRLAYAGSGNAPAFSRAKSTVVVHSYSQVSVGDQVAKALGLPTNDVEINRTPETVADVIVTLGSDYRS
jgi:LytR cell envelope-related transcriptional attenuator